MKKILLLAIAILGLLLAINACVSSTETTNQAPDAGLQDLATHSTQMPEPIQSTSADAGNGYQSARTFAASQILSWVWKDGFRIDSDPISQNWNGNIDQIPFSKLSFASNQHNYRILVDPSSLVKIGSDEIKLPIVRDGSSTPIGWFDWKVGAKTAKVFDLQGKQL